MARSVFLQHRSNPELVSVTWYRDQQRRLRKAQLGKVLRGMAYVLVTLGLVLAALRGW